MGRHPVAVGHPVADFLCIRRYSNQTLPNKSQKYYCSVQSLLRKTLLSLTSNGHQFTGQQPPCYHALVSEL